MSHPRCTLSFGILLLAFGAIGDVFADGPSDNRKDSVRPIPPPGIEIPAQARQQLEQELQSLQSDIAALKERKDTFIDRYLPDVEIFSRAIELALQENGFFETSDVAKAEELLRVGKSRAQDLGNKQTPWARSVGRYATVRGFRSRLDGTVQPYGVSMYRLPLEGGRGDVWCRGRSEKGLELQFLASRLADADPKPTEGTLMIHPFGRYCNANKLAGEIDTLEALDHAIAEYRLSPDRIAIRGFSMGGAAAWHLAVHYPDRWFAATPGAGFSETPDFLKVFQSEDLKPFAFEQKLWQMYDCPVWVRNLKMVPTIAYSGALDKQKQAADIMAKAAWELPMNERFELMHIVAPDTGHQVTPEARQEIERRLKALDPRKRDHEASRIVFTTCTLRYNQVGPLTIDALTEHWVPTTISIASSDKSLRVQTDEGLQQFSLDFLPEEMEGFIYGRTVEFVVSNRIQEIRIPLRSDRSWGASFRRTERGWDVVSPIEPPKTDLTKRHGSQGPIDDAFMEPFLFVRPSEPGMHPTTQAWVAQEMEHAQREWHRQMRGDVRIKSPEEVTPEDLKKYNLVLWGDPKSNPMVEKVKSGLPIQWTSETLRVGDHTVSASDHVPVLIYPNPLAPQRYVVLNSGFTYREYDYLNNARQVPKLPDWAIVDIRVPADARWPGKIVEADFFDEQWQIKTAKQP